MRFVGTEGEYGEELGLTKDWAAPIVRHVGKYGEVYERNGLRLQTRHPARFDPALECRWHPVRPADPLIIAGGTSSNSPRMALSGADGDPRAGGATEPAK
jgi:hypothetical protein